jgi:acetylornithine deacetylase/succinyl-diaminopimelate desuccinylase-like protein
MADQDAARAAATTELLQALIRNRCVNDGTPTSGEEVRNADLLRSFVEGRGLDLAHWDAGPGRRSLIARIEGSDPTAPSVCLMGHTDVVPVNPDGWTRDPFGGELVDGEVWGRGAVDMLNMTASMAVAFRELADRGFRPKGDVVYFAVADEEASGVYGAEWLARRDWDAMKADYVLTENGGLLHGPPEAPIVNVNVAEKGYAWRRLRVRGTPGHGSMPFGADNALIKAAEVVRRLSAHRPRAQLSDLWRQRVENLGLDDDTRTALLDEERVWDACEQIRTFLPAAARHFHACTHMTISPNVLHAGQKVNVIPDRVEIDVDIRTLPGQTAEKVDRELHEALGDLAAEVELVSLGDHAATRSPHDTPLFEALTRAARLRYPGVRLQPELQVGLTDARVYRDRGSIAYGTGLLSRQVSAVDFGSRFHGNDERIDVESLGIMAAFWIHTVEALQDL